MTMKCWQNTMAGTALLLLMASCLPLDVAIETETKKDLRGSNSGPPPSCYNCSGEERMSPNGPRIGPILDRNSRAGENAATSSTHEDTNESTHNDKKRRNKVVVIGCGPGGMFFLHALASKRKRLQAEGDTDGLAELPEVTVYEKASGPGGVWRLNSDSAIADVNMFGGLWTNSPSTDIEFFDYTFRDHFGQAMPVYLPRRHLLEYMIARVTSVEDVFQHVKFKTQVTWVEYNESIEKFVVDTVDLDTGIQTVNEFDHCVWAGGTYNRPNYPNLIHRMLRNSGYAGEVLHSARLDSFGSSLKGKKLVLIGDSHSAEDLALQALKTGAEHVYITSARGNGIASTMSSWPGNRAESLECLPSAVTLNGTGLSCSEVEWDDEEEDYVPIEDGETVELSDVAAVVYCTGYSTTMNYLSPDLRYKCRKQDWSVPEEWRSQRNSLTRDMAHVEPSEELYSKYVCDNIYRHTLSHNPKMMYIQPITDYYIAEIDAIAWSFAAYVSGETVLPSREEMEMRNYLERLDELSIPQLRLLIDDEYDAAADSLWKRRPDHWLFNDLSETPDSEYFSRERLRHEIRLVARDQWSGGHGAGWGSYDSLSSRGELVVDQLMAEAPSREFPVRPEETEWRTFRDIDPSPFHSIYTGTKAAPLKAHWMDLDDDGDIMMQ